MSRMGALHGFVLLAAAWLAGCSAPARYRYVDVPAEPAQAADQLAVRAYQLGLEVGPMRMEPRLTFELQKVHWLEDPQQASGSKPGEQPGKPAAGAPPAPDEAEAPAGSEQPEWEEGRDYELLYVATVEIEPLDDESRISIRSDVLTARELENLFPLGPALDYQTVLTVNPIDQTLAWDLVSHFGWRWSRPGGAGKNAVDLDAAFRIGGRILRFGGDEARPSPAYSLALLAGAGVGMGAHGLEFRPAAVLSLQRQETARPAPDELLVTGQRYSLEAGVEAMLGDVARGLAGRIELRHANTFGVYLAFGYMFEPDRTPVVTLGLTMGAMPMATAGALYLYLM